MLKEFRFYKPDLNEAMRDTMPEMADQWYVDLDDYPGSLAELQMVEGADKLLELLANGKREVTLLASTSSFVGASKLNHRSLVQPGWYQCNYPGAPSQIWLCRVIEYVFGQYPQVIYWKLKEPKDVVLNQYELAIAISDIYGYLIPRPGESRSKAFDRAKAEFVKNTQRRIDAVESISFEKWETLQ